MGNQSLKTTRLEEFLTQVRSHKKPYRATIRDIDLLIYPEHVLSPLYCHASNFMADVVKSKKLQGKDVLEIGTGTGLQAIVAAKAGARNVVALDINPYAVLNAKDNFEHHNVKDDVRLSDLFNAVGKDEKFGMIMFEAPYYSFEAKSNLELAVADKNYNSLRGFFRDAEKHLKRRGELLLGFSPFYGDFAVLQNLISKHDYKVLDHHHDVLNGRSWSVMHLRK